MPGDRATLRWNPASGPVTGYEVRVARNGAAPLAETLVIGTEVTLTAAVGDLLQVSVRAFHAPNGLFDPFQWGPVSASSEPIRFGGSASVAEAFAVLDCPSCGRIDLRLLPGDSAASVAHPSGGPWDLVGFGKFVEGDAIQAALRQRTTGRLWIGDFDGQALVPRASHVEPGFERSLLARAADFDDDGLEEILVWDRSSGNLAFWGLVNDRLVRLQYYPSTLPFALIGIRDLDGDGHADLWFDSGRGDVWVMRTSHLGYIGSVAISVPLSGSVALDLADYDGDAMPDLLWRRADGTLTLALLRGNPLAPQVELRELPRLAGDDLLTPRISVDLDNRPGAEILLQTSRWGSGTLDMLLPGSANPAQRQRLFTTAAGSKLVQVVR